MLDYICNVVAIRWMLLHLVHTVYVFQQKVSKQELGLSEGVFSILFFLKDFNCHLANTKT